MELNVSLFCNGKEVNLSHTVMADFGDAERIGNQVGRLVAKWIKERPIRAGASKVRFDVMASWSNGGAHSVNGAQQKTPAAAGARPHKKRAK